MIRHSLATRGWDSTSGPMTLFQLIIKWMYKFGRVLGSLTSLGRCYFCCCFGTRPPVSKCHFFYSSKKGCYSDAGAGMWASVKGGGRAKVSIFSRLQPCPALWDMGDTRNVFIKIMFFKKINWHHTLINANIIV